MGTVDPARALLRMGRTDGGSGSGGSSKRKGDDAVVRKMMKGAPHK